MDDGRAVGLVAMKGVPKEHLEAMFRQQFTNVVEEEVGKMLRELTQRRKEKGWSVRRLAREAGVEPSTVLRIESRERRPSLATYVRLRLVLEAA